MNTGIDFEKLHDSIEDAMTQAASDSNDAVYYHVMADYTVINSPNQNEPRALHSVRAAGGDAIDDASDLDLFDAAHDAVLQIERDAEMQERYNYDEFIRAFAETIHESEAEADSQRAGFSRQLTEDAREEIEQGGATAGVEQGREFNKAFENEAS